MADKTYNYTGGVQSFTAPATGTYTITAHGGSGSTGSGGSGSNGPYDQGYATALYTDGGYGGTVVAKLAMTANQTIYIAVGGSGGLTQGSNGVTAVNGGWNGGQAGKISSRNGYVWGGAGAGATSITTTNRGVLANYASYQSEVLMVGGGGGGASTLRAGGGGGGTTGGDGQAYLSDSRYIAKGGTQTAGGAGTNNGAWGGNGSFGVGGTSEGNNSQYQWPGGGGGGGWYGGGGGCASNTIGNSGSGAGGSGYINTSKMTSVSNTQGGPASNWGSGHGNVTIDYPNITISYNKNFSGTGTTPSSTSAKAGTAQTLAAAINRVSDRNITNFNITYNANGGTSTPATQQGSKIVTTPYSFNKWAAGSTSGTQYSASASYTPTANITMYAIWTAGTTSTTYKSLTFPSAITRNDSTSTTTFNITYNANGGNSTPATQQGKSTTLTDYTFNGWHEGSATGTTHAAGSSWNPTKATTIYAGWTPSSTTVYQSITVAAAITKNATVSTTTLTTSYNVNGGNSATPSSQTSTRTNTTPQNFNGWHEGSATGTNHAAGSSWQPHQATTLYAAWTNGTTTYSYSNITLPAAATKANTTAAGYTVSYNANGHGTTPNSQTVTNTIKYTFNGWYTATSGGTKAGNAGATYAPTANRILYAQYTSTTMKGSITLPTPSAPGYAFKGWYKEAACTNLAGLGGATYTPDATRTLYAKWQPLVWINVNGTWKAAQAWVNINGTWKKCIAWTNVSGTWKN